MRCLNVALPLMRVELDAASVVTDLSNSKDPGQIRGACTRVLAEMRHPGVV